MYDENQPVAAVDNSSANDLALAKGKTPERFIAPGSNTRMALDTVHARGGLTSGDKNITEPVAPEKVDTAVERFYQDKAPLKVVPRGENEPGSLQQVELRRAVLRDVGEELRANKDLADANMIAIQAAVIDASEEPINQDTNFVHVTFKMTEEGRLVREGSDVATKPETIVLKADKDGDVWQASFTYEDLATADKAQEKYQGNPYHHQLVVIGSIMQNNLKNAKEREDLSHVKPSLRVRSSRYEDRFDSKTSTIQVRDTVWQGVKKSYPEYSLR